MITELIVPVRELGLVAGFYIRPVKRQGQLVHFCRADGEQIGNLHVLVEGLGIGVAVLEKLVHVGGVVVDGIEHGIAEEDTVRAGAIEIEASIRLVHRLGNEPPEFSRVLAD